MAGRCDCGSLRPGSAFAGTAERRDTGTERAQPEICRTCGRGDRGAGAGIDPADCALRQGFVSNIAVLIGIVIGGVVATITGKMNFDKVVKAPLFDMVLPFEIATPTFDPI